MQSDTSVELQERLIALLDYIGERAKTAEGFAMEQLPLVAREIVAWDFWSNLVGTLMGVVLLTLAAYLIILICRKAEDWLKQVEFPVPLVASLFIAFFSACGGFGFMSTYLMPFIKAATAPRLVVIDYVRSLR